MSASSSLDFHVEPDAEIDIAELMAMFHESNSQERTPAELAAIRQAILDDGYTAEMVILNTWNDKIVSGHGRVQACWDLGYRGRLPVILKHYAGDLAHRLAMLRWNRARGHQEPAQEDREIAALLGAFEAEELATALAKPAAAMQALADGGTGLSARVDPPAEVPHLDPQDPTGPDPAWPWLKVTVAPEAYALYQSFLEQMPGRDEAWKFGQLLAAVDEKLLNACTI